MASKRRALQWFGLLLLQGLFLPLAGAAFIISHSLLVFYGPEAVRRFRDDEFVFEFEDDSN